MATKREPYVGPRPFEERDKEVFFGRDEEVDELVSLISAHQATLLYAQSGVGKTSLVKASLIPTLIYEERFEVLPPARVRSHDARPRAGKIDNIYVYNALGYLSRGQLSESQRSKMTLTQFLQTRKQPDRSFFKFFHRRQEIPELGEVPSQCVVIFDQFEELFTLYPERFEDRQTFFEQVSDALQADKVLRVVFAMREDYIAQLDPYVAVLPEKLRTRFRLEPLRQHTALEAIKEPLRERLPNGQFRERSFDGVQRSFEKDVAERLVANLQTIQVKTPTGEKEVLGEFIDPVQLQIVGQTLWRKLQPEDKTITHEHLKLHGDVSKALGDFYETCIKAAAAKGKIDQSELRVLFERALITSSGRRGMVYRADKDLIVGGMPVAAIDEFEDQHIIRAELRSNERWYELSHDRFIQPIRDANKEWRLQQPFAEQQRDELEAKTAEWIRAGRDRSLLLQGAQANDAKNWLSSPEATSVGYSNEMYAFVTASQAAQQQRRARSMRLAFAAAVAVAISLLGLTVFAFQQRTKAVRLNSQLIAQSEELRAQTALAMQKQLEAERAVQQALYEKTAADKARRDADGLKTEAEAALASAQIARDEAKLQEGLALAQKGLFERQEKIARSRAMAALSTAKLEDDPELSAALALAALDVDVRPTRQAEDALRSALSEQTQVLATFSTHSNPDGPPTDEFDDSLAPTISFSPDGKSILTADSRGVSLTEIGTAKAFAPPHSMALSPDGKLVVVSSVESDGFGDGKRLAVLDVASKQVVAELKGQGGDPSSASFSPDSKFIITASTDLTARVWDAQTGQSLAELKPWPKKPEGSEAERELDALREIKHVFLSAGGRRAVIAVEDEEIIFPRMSLWDVRTGKEIGKLGTAFGNLVVLFSPDGNVVLTQGRYATARLWDANSGEEWSSPDTGKSKDKAPEPSVLRGHTSMVLGASFSLDGEYIVTASLDNTARVWWLNTGEVMSQLLGHTNAVNSAAFSPDGQRVVTASNDGTARVWEAETGKELNVLRGHKGVVKAAAFSPDGKLVVTTSGDGTMRLWEVNQGQGASTLGRNGESAEVANFSPNGELIVTGGSDGYARIFTASTLTSLTRFSHSGSVYDARFSPDNKLLVTAGDFGGTAKVWDLATGKEKFTLTGHKSTVFRASFSPDGRVIATTSGDKTVGVWDASTGKQKKILNGHTRQVIGVAFSRDGRFIATTSWDNTTRVWDWSAAEGTEEKYVLRGHTAAVIGVAFSPHDNLVASASYDGTARLWDMATGKELAGRVIRHTGNCDPAGEFGLSSVAFTRDGRFILTAGQDRTAQVWEASTGWNVAILRGHTSQVRKAAFSPDGRSIVTSSTDGTTRFYPYETFAPADELLKIARMTENVRMLTDAEKCEFLVKSDAQAAPIKGKRHKP